MIGQNVYVKPSETNGNVNEKKDQYFVDRVASIPLVKDSVSTAQAIANKTSIGRFALSTANSTLNTVAQYATSNQPKYLQSYYQTYLQPQIEKADAFGCRSLDTLQSKVPIINQPSYQIIDGVKVRIDKTIQTVTHPAHVVVQNANKKFSTVVDNFEGAVDRYLPPSSNGHSNNSTANGNAKQVNKDKDVSNDNQVKRVYGVLNEASYRLTVMVTDQVNRSTSGIPKSRQDVSELTLVKKLQENIKFVQDTLAQSVIVYGDAAQKRLPDSVISHAHQAIDFITHVTTSIQQQVAGLVEYIKSPEAPEWLKQRLTYTVKTVNEQLAYIKTEFARTDINYVAKAKGITVNLQKQVLPLLEKINSQIKIYADVLKEKAQNEMNTPLHYFGINQKVKVD